MKRRVRYTRAMESTDRQRWARVKHGLAHKLPGIPRDWVRVLPTPPGYTKGDTLLDARPDRPLQEWTDHLEFRDEPTGGNLRLDSRDARPV
jgi:hypothetical protein